MNTRRTDARIVGEEVVNAGATPKGNQVPSQVQNAANDQVPVNPQAMTDGEVRVVLFQMVQGITTQAQAITAQTNREIVLRENQNASTMASRLRDFMRMNPPIVLRSKVDE